MSKKVGKKSTSVVGGSGAKEAPSSAQLGIHLAQVAWRVAVPFLLFSVGGIMIDRKFDVEPLFTLLGLVAAIAAVSAVVYRYVDTRFPTTFGGSEK